MAELEAAVQLGNPRDAEAELGDLLFALTSLGRLAEKPLDDAKHHPKGCRLPVEASLEHG